jgi:hypothetical protein
MRLRYIHWLCELLSLKGIEDRARVTVATTAAWLLPAGRTKNGRAHFMPFSQLAHEAILEAFGFGDEKSLTSSPHLPSKARRSLS